MLKSKIKIVKHNFIRIAFYIIIFLTIFSCQNRPKEVLDKKKMEKVMYDVYIAEAMIENDGMRFATPSQKENLMASVFKKHNISEAQWDSSLVWYADHIKVYLQMNDSVKSRLKRAQGTIEKELYVENVDNSDLYKRNQTSTYIPKIYDTSIADARRGLIFNLDSNTITQKSPTPVIDFSFNVLGVSPDIPSKLQMVLVAQYKDTTIYHKQILERNSSYIFPIQKNLGNDKIVNLSGYIRPQNHFSTLPGVLIYDITLGSSGGKLPRGNLRRMAPESNKLQKNN